MASSSTTEEEATVASDPPPSKVKEVLVEGRKQLWNAQLPSFIAFFCDPIRDFLLDPSFQIASIVLPPLCIRFPYCDALMAKFIHTAIFGPMRYMYLLQPHPKEENPRELDLRSAARNDLIVTNKASLHLPKFKRPSDLNSAIRGAIAFTLSVTADLVGAVLDHKKMKKWFEALTEFKAYLDVSGVGSELEEAMMKPLLRGRLLDNVKILNDIQEKFYVDRCAQLKKYSAEDLKGPIQEGQRMMRFATAAYGTEMIRSALDRDAHPHELENQKKAIAFHAQITEDDLRILYVDDGGCMKVLRHFVAIDHETKSVVLALRGTLSISGALTDMKAMDCDFCCGKSHKGISEMADNIWHESGAKIIKLFEDEGELLRDYSFVITGHSLGAGTACLLNVKCHVEQLLGPDRVVKCYGFAPPPTYFCASDQDPETASRLQKAIDNSLCYIHDNDCVPLLSVVSIRRLAALLDAVDNQTEHMWAYRRFKIFWEWEEIPQNIFDAVKEAETGELRRNAESSNVASKLRIPAKLIIWMKKDVAASKFEAIGCTPEDVAEMDVFMCQDMISDHMPEQYEDALDSLCGIA